MDSDGAVAPPLVILDANLLYPFHLRNLLIQFGVDAIIAPRWTALIQDEWIENLASVGRVPRRRLLRTTALMNAALPAAEVRDWQAHMAGLALPDPGDRHVLAAALACGAQTILTMNLRDFPPHALSPYGVSAAHPDRFLSTLYDTHPELLRASIDAAHNHLSRSAPSFKAYIDILAHQGLPLLAHCLRK